MPWRPCDGIVDHKAVDEGDSPAASRMMDNVQNLALAFYFLNDTASGLRACQQLDTWFLQPATRMNPNWLYGQSSPGLDTGSHGTMIEWTNIVGVLDSAVLLRNASCWSDALERGLQAWVGQLLESIRVTNADEMNGERDMKNNHGTWYDSTVSGLALFSGNVSLAHGIAANVSTVRIDPQILPSGEMPLETARTNGQHYTVYNLQAFANVATFATDAGVDLWTYRGPQGQSLRGALDYTLPFALGQQPWPFPELDPPDWTGLLLPLRRASRALRNETYEMVARHVAGSASAYANSLVNLLVPPIFNVSAY